MSSSLGGLIQTFFGGQPLLIIGVAEPLVLVYGFMYEFAKSQDFQDAFVPWCTWVLIFTALFLFTMAALGAPLPCLSVTPVRMFMALLSTLG